MSSDESAESQKWQQHLSLLREQYLTLYTANAELQQKYAALVAGNGEQTESGFIGRLLAIVASLYSQERYRFDIYFFN